jgi:hypothetical protein
MTTRRNKMSKRKTRKRGGNSKGKKMLKKNGSLHKGKENIRSQALLNARKLFGSIGRTL